MENLLMFGVFALVAGLTLTIFLLLQMRRQRVEERLRNDAEDEASLLRGDKDLVLGDMTRALAAQIPVAEGDRSQLERELRQAGYYRPTALLEYVALRAIFIFVPLVGAALFALLTESVEQASWIWMAAVVMAMLGFSLPRVFVYFKGKARMHAIERGLPTAIDMLTLCMTGGLNVMISLTRVVKELHLAYPVLASELEIVRQQAEMRTLEFALTQFADRVGLPHLRNLLVIMSQSENLGTDAVTTLREYADDMRINMRQRADEMANKAPFKLLFPAYLLAIGAAVLLISPTVLEFAAFRQANMIGQTITEGKRALQEPAVPTAPAPASDGVNPR